MHAKQIWGKQYRNLNETPKCGSEIITDKSWGYKEQWPRVPPKPLEATVPKRHQEMIPPGNLTYGIDGPIRSMIDLLFRDFPVLNDVKYQFSLV